MLYGQLSPTGQVYTINPYQGFIVSSGPLVGTQYTPGWLTSPGTTASDIANAGLLPVTEANQPSDIYTTAASSSLVLDQSGDHYNQVWSTVDLPLEQMKTSVCNAVDAKAQALFNAGYSPTLPALAGHTLQMRDADDKGNWTLSLMACQAEIAAGNGAVEGETIITTDNAMITISFTDCAAVLNAMLAWGKAIIFNGRTLKNTINGAGDTATIKSVDLTQGWPS